MVISSGDIGNTSDSVFANADRDDGEGVCGVFVVDGGNRRMSIVIVMATNIYFYVE